MPYVQSDMKGLNRRDVFDLIASVGTISRVDIARSLGTSMPTVLKITNVLLEKGFVRMSGEEKTARGRRPQLLQFNPDQILGIGVDYDGSTVKAAVCDYWGRELVFGQWMVDDDFDALLNAYLPSALTRMLDESGIARDRLLGIGICVPGSLDTANSVLHLGPLSGIRISDTPADTLSRFSKVMGLPVYCFNDVNAAATGEYVLRKLKKDDLVYISAGAGIGAGIILDGELRTGSHFAAGEIGHLVFDPNFTTDIQEPGWFETQLAHETLCRKSPSYKRGVKPAELLEYIAQHLALAIANIANVLDVKYIILGGDLVKEMGDGLHDRVLKYARRLCLYDVEVYGASCENPSLAGATSLALSREVDNALADE